MRYDVTSHGKTRQLEYAVVGKERSGKSQLFWLEARRFDEADSFFVKWLVPRGLEGPAGRMLIGDAGTSARLVIDGSRLPEESGRDTPKYVATETVETQAGRFSSKKFEYPSGLVWLSRKVPVFGVVRLTGKGGELELVAYGLRGAISELTEAPETAIIP